MLGKYRETTGKLPEKYKESNGKVQRKYLETTGKVLARWWKNCNKLPGDPPHPPSLLLLYSQINVVKT